MRMHNKTKYAKPADGKSGQAIIFLVAAVVMLAFALIWNFDLHKTIFVKILARDAGDAAVLSSARWQAKSLNLIGELNIIQAAMMSEDLAGGQPVSPEAESLSELRTRLSFVGPMVALVSAQQVAKHNGIFNNRGFSEQLYRHADEVRTEYQVRYEQPYESADHGRTAWDDYADMLIAVAEQGMPVMPTNSHWFQDYASQAHYLLNPDFYDAVGSRNWCWFHFNAMNLLENYINWTSWPALPEIVPREPVNSEILSLKLSRIELLDSIPVLNADSDSNLIEDWRDAVNLHVASGISTNILTVATSWHVYDQNAWSSWRQFVGAGFPFEGRIREEYDVVGADASVRLNVHTERLTPGRTSQSVQWTAAGKPFGHLPGPVPVNAYGMVIPAFTDVRLIPVDASTASNEGSREGWGIHIYEHLPEYMQRGPSALDPSCWYCRQLLEWERMGFRRSGRAWLREHSDTCHVSGPGPGPTPRGGTRRGH